MGGYGSIPTSLGFSNAISIRELGISHIFPLRVSPPPLSHFKPWVDVVLTGKFGIFALQIEEVVILTRCRSPSDITGFIQASHFDVSQMSILNA